MKMGRKYLPTRRRVNAAIHSYEAMAKADLESGAGHADELLGGNVGRDEGGAHRPPGERLAGEEVILGVFLVALLVAGHPEADPEDEDGIADEDGVVERRERAGHESVRCANAICIRVQTRHERKLLGPFAATEGTGGQLAA